MSKLIPEIDFEQLSALMLEPNWADVNPSSHIALAVNLPGNSVTEAEALDIRNWIFRQPVPVIGIAEDGCTPGLKSSLDIVVSNDEEKTFLLEKIALNPQASSVLVQVSRSTQALSIPQALALESLAYSTLQGGEEFARWLQDYRSNRGDKSPVQISEPAVLVQRRDSQLEIILNTPENRNALSVPMRDALADAFKLVSMDPSIEQVHVSGNGPCFSAGGDLSEFGATTDQALAHQIRLLRMPAQYLAPEASRYTFHLHGACIGAGIEMPAFAGRLVASSDTFFHLPEVGMGLVPGAGGCVSIPRRIGRQRMNFLAITGQRLSAEEALEWGLVDEIAK